MGTLNVVAVILKNLRSAIRKLGGMASNRAAQLCVALKRQQWVRPSVALAFLNPLWDAERSS